MLGIGSSAERREKIGIEANRNDGARFVAEGLAALLAQLFDRIARLGFACPGLYLLIADGLALDRRRGHVQSVMRKCTGSTSGCGPLPTEQEGGVRVDLADVKARIHARNVLGGHIDPAAVIRYRTRAGDRGLSSGTALRGGTTLKGSGRGRMS